MSFSFILFEPTHKFIFISKVLDSVSCAHPIYFISKKFGTFINQFFTNYFNFVTFFGISKATVHQKLQLLFDRIGQVLNQ